MILKVALALFVTSIVTHSPKAEAADTETLGILCRTDAEAECSKRVITALTNLGCELKIDSVQCKTAESDSGKEYCSIDSTNCSEPRGSLFIQTSCFSGERVSLKKQDRGLTLAWWMGAFGSYIKDICVK